jgi:hypothetical protein
LFTPTNLELLRHTLRHLRAQTVRDQLEVLITTPVAGNVRPVGGELDGFARVAIIEVGPVETLAAAQVIGIDHATSPVVAIGEDHSFPEPGWAAALLEAHRQDVAAVGPAVLNANPATLTSWGNYIPYFGFWTDPSRRGIADGLPSHNSSYKRDVLLRYREQLALYLAVEGIFHHQLRRDGYQLWFEPAARTRHVNYSRFWWFTRQSLCGSRLYGGTRMVYEHWSWLRRLLYIAGSPLIPVVRLRRMLACPVSLRMWPVLAWGALFHGWGEMTGYALGVGAAEKKYLNFETDRLRFVTAADRQAVETM